MKLVILGAQASGKGTQGEILAKRLKLKRLSTGDIFREEIKNNTKLGKKVASYINKGVLVPDSIVNDVIRSRIEKKDNFILDGFPRNINQAKFLDKIAKIDKVLYIEITDEEAVKRISSRRVCPKCGKTYNLLTNSPKKRNICDFCHSKLEIRSDDKEEVVRKRLELFHNETEPLLKFYEKKGILVKINGMSSIDEVSRSIRRALSK